MTVLVVGGDGYIGAHVVRALAAESRPVLIVDDGSTGRRSRNPGTPFASLDVTATGASDALAQLMREHRVTSVIHLAALKDVEASVQNPVRYVTSNIVGLGAVIEAARSAGVSRFVFSSTAAVYGEAAGAELTEASATRPINPYGWSKLAGEEMLAAAARTHGFAAVSLRYFNVAGAQWPELGDVGDANLIPLVFDCLERSEAPVVFGADYPTRDGSCIRDFVHVSDIAAAHVRVLDHLTAASSPHEVFNLGTGQGSSVLEVVALAREVSGIDIAPIMATRRAGDPAEVVADVHKITAEIGWRATRDLAAMVESAWIARRHAASTT